MILTRSAAPIIPASDLKRFEERVMPEPNSGCWLWTGPATEQGYGIARVGGRAHGAHRLSYRLFHGEIGSLFVCHTCDNRICVNPDHLFLGTHADNMLDMRRKGRFAKGAKIVQGGKLAEADVREIRRRLAGGEGVRRLAATYGVHHTTISEINTGKIWKWLS